MKGNREYVLLLPWKINGDKFYFYAGSDEDAHRILGDILFLVQDICEHGDFYDGKCGKCKWECDHEEIEENHCLMCGVLCAPTDPREEREWVEER